MRGGEVSIAAGGLTSCSLFCHFRSAAFPGCLDLLDCPTWRRREGDHLPFKSYLFSEEQKKDTQGLTLFLSDDGGRYIASEKQVSSSFSSSVLMEQMWTYQLWTRDMPRPMDNFTTAP